MKPTHILIASLTLVSCQQKKAADEKSHSPSWQAELLSTLDHFEVPECALSDPARGFTYVSNIVSEPDRYWEDDGQGFISRINTKTHLFDQLKWFHSQPDQVIHSPKGLCLHHGFLYFTDNTRVMRVAGGKLELVAEGFTKANDLATDGTDIWVSDTAAGKVFALKSNGDKREIPAPEGVNGITFDGERMFGVSWDLHEIYELDPSGEKEPEAFGLAKHFVNLDGIEVLEDGSFLVSDFMGNAVFVIGPDRKRVRKLIEIPSPADIGIDRSKGLLFVPQFMENKVSIYQLSR